MHAHNPGWLKPNNVVNTLLAVPVSQLRQKEGKRKGTERELRKKGGKEKRMRKRRKEERKKLTRET